MIVYNVVFLFSQNSYGQLTMPWIKNNSHLTYTNFRAQGTKKQKRRVLLCIPWNLFFNFPFLSGPHYLNIVIYIKGHFNLTSTKCWVYRWTFRIFEIWLTRWNHFQMLAFLRTNGDLYSFPLTCIGRTWGCRPRWQSSFWRCHRSGEWPLYRLFMIHRLFHVRWNYP